MLIRSDRIDRRCLITLTIFAIVLIDVIKTEILTPPYFNLAEKKKITATATCGVDSEGPELYCKLVGANAENDIDVNLIQGQVRTIFLRYIKINRANFWAESVTFDGNVEESVLKSS